MIILGIDPGYAIVGYGIIEKTANYTKVIDYGVIVTHKSEKMANRLNKIYDGVYVNDVSIGNLTVDEATKKVTDQFKNDLDYSIVLKHKDVEKEISLADLMAKIDADMKFIINNIDNKH